MILEHVDRLILELSNKTKATAKSERKTRSIITMLKHPRQALSLAKKTIQENPKEAAISTAKHVSNIIGSGAVGFNLAGAVKSKTNVDDSVEKIKEKGLLGSVGSLIKNSAIAHLRTNNPLSATTSAIKSGIDAVATANEPELKEISRRDKQIEQERIKEKETKAKKEYADSFYEPAYKSSPYGRHQRYARFT